MSNPPDDPAEPPDLPEAREVPKPAPGRLVRIFARVADIGNRLPDPLTLFVILAGMVVLASVLAAGASADIIQNDGSVVTRTVESLLSREGIRWMFLSAIDNFINFAPLGPVLTVMIGIGVAERTGFITMGLRALVGAVPPALITATLVFACVMSSMAADAGYIVLTPLGAILFAGLGRHPLAGLAAAFAGVSGGYSANLLITGLDPMLARLTQQAAQTIDPTYVVQATSNYYFMVVSTIMITIIGTLVTTRVVEPLLGTWNPSDGDGSEIKADEPTAQEKRAFRIAMGFAGVVAIGIALLAIIPTSPLRDTITDQQAPIDKLYSFFESIEVLISLLFIVPAIIYGVLTKAIKNDKDVAKMAADSMASMGPYIVLAFVAGQFVAYFNHTNLGSVSAVKGADLLQSIGLTGAPLLIAFLIVAATMNMFVGSASAKWAFMAPIFVPMMMMMDLSPEAVQATYRVGDSVTNIITPLMPYLPIIIVFAQKYDRRAGLGTIISAMLPYSIAFFFAWTLLLLAWVFLGVPFGPESTAVPDSVSLL
jgi:aminobenzoyl-glutamate transport protein